MNKGWILFHLREAQEELVRTIAEMDASTEVDEIEFGIAFAHMYNHLNTAWNSRAASKADIASHSEENFYKWRAFPSDISMGE